MQRLKSRRANPDSDQSISDEEEELDHEHGCISLADSVQRKEGSEILCRLELFKGNHECDYEASDLSHMKQRSPSIEDEVEMPNFYDEDAISENEGKNVGSRISSAHQANKFSKDTKFDFRDETKDLSSSWSFLSKEAEALVDLGEHASRKQMRSSRGVKGKGKPKFSFRFHSHGETPSLPSNSKDDYLAINEVPEILDAIKLTTEPLEEIHNDEENLPEIMHCGVDREQSKSMVELLDSLQHATTPLQGNSKYNTGKRGKQLQVVVQGNKSLQGDNREVSPDDVDCCGPSSDIATSDKDIELAIPSMKRKPIVDQFQEAFGATFLNDNRKALHDVSKAPRGGLFWRLQQVMQIEKERDTDFLEKIGNEAFQSDEQICIFVKLMSKRLEAKLTVCHCFICNNSKSLQCSEPIDELTKTGSNKKIIFNPRVSVDVDLEIGNCICIHPPWKEVKVHNDESIILAEYFSNFQPSSSNLLLSI